jgi:hypothetical protein
MLEEKVRDGDGGVPSPTLSITPTRSITGCNPAFCQKSIFVDYRK